MRRPSSWRAPTTRQSETSIKSELVSHSENKRLKRAMLLSAFASNRLIRPAGITMTGNGIRGKQHNQALIPLTHRRLAILFAIIRDG